jgi:N-glycosylase/DNA lyase
MRMILELSPRYLPFNLEKTFDCGQTFRWIQENEDWIGMIQGEKVTIRQSGTVLIYEGIGRDDLVRYLNLDLDPDLIITSIRKSISEKTGQKSDYLFEMAVKSGEGLRIIRQDPWECLISFICSQNSNIPAIKRRISLLCQKFGEHSSAGLPGFPTAAHLADADPGDLRGCSCGYRAHYLSASSLYIQ